MAILHFLNRLQRMDYLIRTRTTGNPPELAEKMAISERSVYMYINSLRDLGAPVEWSCRENSYIYLEEGKLEIRFIAG